MADLNELVDGPRSASDKKQKRKRSPSSQKLGKRRSGRASGRAKDGMSEPKRFQCGNEDKDLRQGMDDPLSEQTKVADPNASPSNFEKNSSLGKASSDIQKKVMQPLKFENMANLDGSVDGCKFDSKDRERDNNNKQTGYKIRVIPISKLQEMSNDKIQKLSGHSSVLQQSDLASSGTHSGVCSSKKARDGGTEQELTQETNFPASDPLIIEVGNSNTKVDRFFGNGAAGAVSGSRKSVTHSTRCEPGIDSSKSKIRPAEDTEDNQNTYLSERDLQNLAAKYHRVVQDHQTVSRNFIEISRQHAEIAQDCDELSSMLSTRRHLFLDKEKEKLKLLEKKFDLQDKVESLQTKMLELRKILRSMNYFDNEGKPRAQFQQKYPNTEARRKANRKRKERKARVSLRRTE